MTQTITVDEVARDILVIRGATLESTATAFLAGDETVLVDALASVDEALAMRRHLEEERGARVATIVATHYMDDHVAGIAAFPEARLLAHRLFGFTHASSHCGDGSFDGFRRADSVIDAPIELIAGVHRLHVFGNAGKTVCMLNVDAPASHVQGSGWRERVLALDVLDCLPHGLQATPFEQHWHGQNLQRIVERQLFRVSYA